MKLRFTPRSLSAADYVRELHRLEDHVAVLVRNREQNRTMQRILPADVVASESFQSWLFEQNRNGADVFIGMNPVKAGSKYRTKEYIREVRHLYVDLDEDAGISLQAIRTSGDVPDLNFVLDTSPGKHQVVWRVEGFSTEEAEQTLRALASNFGGDPAATDISRLLRLPGFTNHKYKDQFTVRLFHETDAVHQPTDFRVQHDTPDSPRHASESTSRKLPLGHRSQSEADWAYAKRALARGDDPEQIVHRIADYRSEDKADPIYYARHTVEKVRTAALHVRDTSSASAPSNLARESNQFKR